MRDRQNAKGLCTQGACKKLPVIGAVRCAEHLLLIKVWRKDNKISCINKYGGRCRCCKITILDFLTIDHIKDDGAIQRKRNPEQAKNIHLYLKKKKYPKGYQILCANSQLGKVIGKGFCPHHPKIDLRIPQ